jgi:hypothetical protein
MRKRCRAGARIHVSGVSGVSGLAVRTARENVIVRSNFNIYLDTTYYLPVVYV